MIKEGSYVRVVNVRQNYGTKHLDDKARTFIGRCGIVKDFFRYSIISYVSVRFNATESMTFYPDELELVANICMFCTDTTTSSESTAFGCGHSGKVCCECKETLGRFVRPICRICYDY